MGCPNPSWCKEELDDWQKKLITCNIEVVEEGQLGKTKGLLQVLWERGWMDKNNVSKYTLKGKINEKRKRNPT